MGKSTKVLSRRVLTGPEISPSPWCPCVIEPASSVLGEQVLFPLHRTRSYGTCPRRCGGDRFSILGVLKNADSGVPCLRRNGFTSTR